MTLTPKQQRFAEEYLVDLNATQAAIRAGYKERSAYSQADRLLKKDEVQAFITEKREALSKKLEMDAAWVLSNLKTVTERCMQAAPVLNKFGQQIVIEDGEGNLVPAYTFNAAGANKALELIGKHLGMFQEKKQPEGGGNPEDDPLIGAIGDSAASDWSDDTSSSDGGTDGQSSSVQQETAPNNELVAPSKPSLGF